MEPCNFLRSIITKIRQQDALKEGVPAEKGPIPRPFWITAISLTNLISRETQLCHMLWFFLSENRTKKEHKLM